MSSMSRRDAASRSPSPQGRMRSPGRAGSHASPQHPQRGASPSAFLRREAAGAQRIEASVVPAEMQVRGETRVGRARREKAEAERKAALLAMVTARHRGRVEEKRRVDALAARARKLHGRLAARPGDVRSLGLLAEATYALRDYLGATLVIQRALRYDELRGHRMHLMLGRCYLRRWRQDGTQPDLVKALAAYREYMTDPEVGAMSAARAR